MWKNLARAFSVVGLGIGMAFLSQLLVAKWLSAYEFGVFSVLFVSSSFGVMFLATPISNVCIRELSKFLSDREKNEKLIAQIYCFVLFCFLFFLFFILLLFALSLIFYQNNSLYLISGLLFFFSCFVSRVVSGISRAHEKIKLAIALDTILRDSCLLVSFFLFVHIFGWHDHYSLFFVFLIVSLSQLLVVSFYFFYQAKSDDVRLFSGIKYKDILIFLSANKSLMLSSSFVNAAQYSLKRIDILIVGFLMGPAIAGGYSLYARIADISGLISVPVNQIVAPKVSKFLYLNDKKNLRKCLRFYGSVAGCASIFFGGGVYVAYSFGFFGFFEMTSEYELPEYLILSFVIVNIINSLYPSSTAILMYSGHDRIARYSALIAAVSFSFVFFVATYFFGLIGSSFSLVFVMGCYKFYMFKKAQLVILD